MKAEWPFLGRSPLSPHLPRCSGRAHVPPTPQNTHTQKGAGCFPKLRHVLAGAGCGPGTPGQLGRAGCPGEPRMDLTPRLGQDTQSLAEAQTGSVYRICQPGSPPPSTTSPGVLGAGRGQAGPVGALAARLAIQARIVICLQHPFFLASFSKPGVALPPWGRCISRGFWRERACPRGKLR